MLTEVLHNVLNILDNTAFDEEEEEEEHVHNNPVGLVIRHVTAHSHSE